MNKKDAENLLTVSADSAMVECDSCWNGNTLTITPVSGWTAGTRYLFGISGFARSLDGRELRPEKYIYFYALNNSPPPLVEWFSPSDGESVSACNFTLEIRFSQPMEKISVETALDVNGIGEKKFEWSDENKTLKIIPDKALSPWTVYRWSINAGAKSLDGVPLVQKISAIYCTDLDRIMPEVIDVYPVIQSDGCWFPTGGNLEEGFGSGLGLTVEFNKPMGDAVIRSIRFEPSLNGRTEKISEKTIVFIPTQDPQPQTVYTLIISGDTKDAEGLKTGNDYRRSFIADIPYLRVLTVSAADGTSLDLSGYNAGIYDNPVLPVSVSEADGGLVRFSLHFSLLLNEEAKQKTALAISLVPFFPGNLDPIALRFVSWVSDDRIIMEWERLNAGSTDEEHYYKLLIPGGRGGIGNGGGLYLQKDICVYLAAIK
jgi:hypothetical protein